MTSGEIKLMVGVFSAASVEAVTNETTKRNGISPIAAVLNFQISESFSSPFQTLSRMGDSSFQQRGLENASQRGREGGRGKLRVRQLDRCQFKCAFLYAM